MKERIVRRKEGKSSSSVQCAYNAITVGSGRHAEPYILAFHYRSDNVAGRPLGTLFGFFEVEVHDEDAAYIVNFLASVAKKEYFTNPRREISDGFETTLHKVNVALAEIAKEGNVSWLGHLHGVLAAVSENTLHFSATGDGVLALVRENTLRPISDGLADTMSEPHPLKTFIEVSSGKLIDGDVLLALSPAVWTLFTPDDLKKNLARLGQKGFEQFLHTALINELPLAGAVIVSVTTAPIPVAAPSKKTSLPTDESSAADSGLLNVWSGQTFEKARASRLRSLTAPKPVPSAKKQKEDYIDKKTGHIYVQGKEETSAQESPWQTKLTLWSHSLTQNWQSQKESIRRFGRRGRKQSIFLFQRVHEQLASLKRQMFRQSRAWWRRRHEAKREKFPSSQPPLPSSFPERVILDEPAQSLSPTAPFASSSLQVTARLIRAGFQRVQTLVFQGVSWLKTNSFSLWQKSHTWWKQQSTSLQRWLTGGAVLVLTLLLGTWFYLDRSTLWEDQSTPAEITTNTPSPVTDTPIQTPEQDEPLATRLADGRVLTAPFNAPPLALVTLDNTAFGVTRDRLVNITTQESIATPELIRSVTAMDDLDALFLWSESGKLLMYTAANKKFDTSNLPLPDGVVPQALGSYLTYLYVLDQKTNEIYRFPRAEGGFGTPLKWSKETVTTATEQPAFTVGESIALINQNMQPALYERGKQLAVTFSGTQRPLLAHALTFEKNSGDLFVLDQKSQRVVRWKTDGTLVAQYFHPSFESASHLAVGEKNTLLVVGSTGTLAFQLP
ncbi:hypothetical protein E6Q11_06340 [Candidatus Dojkabacteria bacterium]|uniref:PPM-type phosphatase domain-containing protein n=1 Tax=Candidatus Dojkabacteria bacterium TaxID=2099670 RepID=A0A5C7J306_9BACT|nr:MAG: hypothetical protein E6Q11_06340 [Candidatus Dojkabacteria bacterium]